MSDTDFTHRLFDPNQLAQSYPDYQDQLAHRETVEARDADTIPADTVLPEDMASRLGTDLYSHQVSAIDELKDGNNVTVATSTSSGKTWIYTLYFALQKQQNPDARALFVYPTKALSADQDEAVTSLLSDVGVDAVSATYDGDTPSDRRPLIRDRTDVIISNFPALNVYLNDHIRWRDVFKNVELLVIDESHTYTGLHGMHVSWTVRRLRRVLEHYGADPQIVCSTATVGNPGHHSQQLTGAEFSVVDEDGSPRGRSEIAFWQPPVQETDKDDPLSDMEFEDGEEPPMVRKSASNEAAEAVAHLGLSDIQTLMFTRSRQATEVATKQAESAARDHPVSDHLNVSPYHAGLNKSKRRDTERQLKTGELDTVISTSALELGIDIGGVDATVLTGYPGTRQSYWQQVGRAGRSGSDSLSLFIPKGEAMDYYILDNPEYILSDDNIEDAVVDLGNNAIYANHVLCASDELPLTEDDTDWFGSPERLKRAIEMWKDAGQMVGSLEHGAQYNGPPRPQLGISMYASGNEQYDIRCVDDDIDMEPLDRRRVYRDFHPGALTLYDGQQYEVQDVVADTPSPHVLVEQVATNEYTQTLNDKQVHSIESEKCIELGDGYEIHAGTGIVDVHYYSYKRMDINTGEPVGMPEPTGMEPVSLHTQLMWVKLPRSILSTIDEALAADERLISPEEAVEGDLEWTLAGGLHGAEHGMIKLAPLELRLDNSDMGGLSTVGHPEVGSPVWFIHDAVEGGVGFAHSVYEHLEAIANRTRDRVDTCDCGRLSGCPACLMSSQCGNDNEPLNRPATVELLGRVLDRV